jgi:hypothetical protein
LEHDTDWTLTEKEAHTALQDSSMSSALAAICPAIAVRGSSKIERFERLEGDTKSRA